MIRPDSRKTNRKRLLFALEIALIQSVILACSGSGPISQTEAAPTESTEACGITGSTDNIYPLEHRKEGTSYSAYVLRDENTDSENYIIQILDSRGNEIQTIHPVTPIFPELLIEDVNLDGYMDIVANTGGTMNEMHDLHLWDSSSGQMVQAAFEGFDVLSYFEVYDGYLMNWVKSGASSGIVQKLVWDGNALVKESEESYELEG